MAPIHLHGSPEYHNAMARMQERQASWSRKARETSEASVSASGSGSSHSDASPPTNTRALANPNPPRNGKNSRTEGKGARKKVAKACLACQKSHLTCDECRPCTRCMKKGIGDQCVEGVRKKAKYLMEGDERAQPPPVPIPAPAPQQAAPPSLPPMSPPAPHFGGQLPVSMLPGVMTAPPPPAPAETARVPDNIWLTAPLPEVQAGQQTLTTDWTLPNDTFSFTNNTANLEYEMFDSMFGSLSPNFPLGDLTTASSTDNSTPSMWSNFGLGDHSNNAAANNHSGNQAVSTDVVLGQDPNNALNPTLAADLSPQNIYNGWTPTTGAVDDMLATTTGNGGERPKKLTPEDVYARVVKAYDYTEGYHVLMQYLTNNFQKDDILRVVRALAVFRPSLIALQMPLTEEDEIFLERSFQRTLIELEKLISFSATPTAVWRRTGELVCVAPQFCKLTGKTEDDMLRSRTMYIYQLFSKQAVIDYWENFAEHAFENTTQNFFQATTLETAKGSVPCAACFTIRRDVFDLPSVVIGQFLPIPPEAA